MLAKFLPILLSFSIANTAIASPEKIRDPAWEAMLNYEVVIITGTTVSYGKLVGHDKSTVTIIEKNQNIKVIDKDTVTELKSRSKTSNSEVSEFEGRKIRYHNEEERLDALDDFYSGNYEYHQGFGMRVTGSVITPIGVGILLSGILTTALSSEYESIYVDGSAPRTFLNKFGIGTIIIGAIHISVGIPLILIGNKRVNDYKNWLNERPALRKSIRIQPTLNYNNGFRFGFGIRF